MTTLISPVKFHVSAMELQIKQLRIVYKPFTVKYLM